MHLQERNLAILDALRAARKANLVANVSSEMLYSQSVAGRHAQRVGDKQQALASLESASEGGENKKQGRKGLRFLRKTSKVTSMKDETLNRTRDARMEVRTID